MKRGMSFLYKILIVEDELMIRQGIKYLIDWELHGFEVIAEAKNGHEALKLIEKTCPDIVITDIVMPVMNGIELLEEITGRYPEIHVIVLSGYSDFEYVKHSFRSGAVDYILKPSLKPDELLASVIKAVGATSGELRHTNTAPSLKHILGRLLSGHSSPEAISTINQRFPKPVFLLFGTDMESSAAPSGMESFLSALNGIEPDFLGESDYERIVFNGLELIYIINTDNLTGNAFIENNLADFVTRVRKISPDSFFVCGNRFHGTENIANHYRSEFSFYLRKRFYHKNECFMRASMFEQPDGKTAFKISTLSKLLSVGNVNQSIDLLSERFSHIVNDRLMDEYDLKSLAQNALYQVIAVMEETMGPLTDLEHLKTHRLTKISKSRFAEDFLTEFSCSLAEISRILQENHDNPDESVMLRILAYIKDNYAEQLTLSHLADRFNLNYNYLSAYFGSNNAEGFIKYLTHIRIDKAMELLSDSDIPVSGICNHVGYSDHSYFTRVFRKATGLTPSAYRAKFKSVLRLL